MTSKNEVKSRDIAIDALRGFGIILMLMGHVGFGDLFLQIKSSFNMATFFLISGYLFKVNHKSELFSFSCQKAKRFLVPFAFFSVLTFILLVGIDLVCTDISFKYIDFLRGIVWPNKGVFPVTGAIWFLTALFCVEVVFFIFECLIRNKFLHICFTFLCMVVSAFISFFDISIPFAIDSAIGLYPFFYIGFIYKINKETLQERLEKRIPILSLLLIIIGLCLIWVNGEANPRICAYGKSYFVYCIAATVINYGFYLMFGALMQKNIRIWKPLIIPGQYSMAYLGMNQLIIYFLNNSVFLLINSQGSIFKLAKSIAMLTIVYLSIYFISKLTYESRGKFLFGK